MIILVYKILGHLPYLGQKIELLDSHSNFRKTKWSGEGRWEFLCPCHSRRGGKGISRVERKTGVSQMVVFPQTLSPHHESVMKITTFLSVNNENLGAIARMSNGT